MGNLIATQKIEEALSMADSLTVMRQERAILTGKTEGMERLNLIRLCYDQLDNLDGSFSDCESFHELMRYTSAMLNDLPTAVVVLDNNLETRFVNRRGQEILPEIAGKISLEEIGGRIVFFLFHPHKSFAGVKLLYFRKYPSAWKEICVISGSVHKCIHALFRAGVG